MKVSLPPHCSRAAAAVMTTRSYLQLSLSCCGSFHQRRGNHVQCRGLLEQDRNRHDQRCTDGHGHAEEQRPNISVDLATVHVAIYDAVNAIVGTHKAFGATPATPAAGASQEAAAAAAAYGVLKGLFPNRAAQYQAAYDDFIAAIPASDAKTRGIAVGTEVATAIVALRANDGRLTAVTYSAGTAPGNFRGVNPVGTFNRFIKPFAVTSLSQFRAAPPPALDSAAYAADFNEVLVWEQPPAACAARTNWKAPASTPKLRPTC